MAIRKREQVSTDMVGYLPDIQMREGKVEPSYMKTLVSSVQAVIQKVNGFVSSGDGTHASWAGNIDAQWMDVYIKTADTEVEIPHGLGRIPKGYLVKKRTKACVIYDSRDGSWTDSVFYLKSSVSDVTVRILVE